MAILNAAGLLVRYSFFRFCIYVRPQEIIMGYLQLDLVSGCPFRNNIKQSRLAINSFFWYRRAYKGEILGCGVRYDPLC